MPFVIAKKETFKYTVRVKQARDSGALEVFDFIGEFKRLDQPEITKLLSKRMQDRELADAVFLGWSNVEMMVKQGDAEVKQPLEVTPTNREALLAEPGVLAAIVNAWLDAVVVGPAKN